MPHHASAKKRLRQAEQRRQRNKAVRSDMTTKMKRVAAAREAGDDATVEAAVRVAVSAIDRAWKRGVIKKNAAARKKSTVMRSPAGTDGG